MPCALAAGPLGDGGGGGGCGRWAPDRQAGDVPGRVFKVGWVLLDVLGAGLGASARIGVSSPVAAKRQVDDNVLRLETVHVARAVPEVGVRRTPIGGIDLLGGLAGETGVSDLVGNGSAIPSPEPHVDRRGRSLHGVPSTTDGVEVGAETGDGRLRLDDASGVVVFARCAVEVTGSPSSNHIGRVHRTLPTGVKDGIARSLVIDAFDLVDLTAVRPSDTVGI